MPLLQFCGAESKTWCNCDACSLNVFNSAGREQILVDWENHYWPTYGHRVRQLLHSFPKLRLVEWFLPRIITSFRDRCAPYWRWEILGERSDVTASVYRLKRTLMNCLHSNPLVEMEAWSPWQGVNHASRISVVFSYT